MTNKGFIDFVLHKLFSLSLQLIFLYMVVLICEWFADKKGYSVFERTWLITIVTLPILTLIIWTILIGRLKLF